MNFRSARGGKRRDEVSLEMTPLIDVVFLLLVFFLLTTTFARPTPTESTDEDTEAVIDVQLPTSGAGADRASTERITLYLDPEGRIYYDEKEPIAANDLKELLLQKRDEGQEVVVDLKADKATSHGATIELLGLVQETGIGTVNFVVTQPR